MAHQRGQWLMEKVGDAHPTRLTALIHRTALPGCVKVMFLDNYQNGYNCKLYQGR